jgi:transcriptional regulator with XRE-family HTH domain
MALVAERAFVSRSTLARVERGDPGVSMGVYASVLFVLGLADRVGDLADPRTDAVGLALEDEQLPQRVRLSRREAGGSPR